MTDKEKIERLEREIEELKNIVQKFIGMEKYIFNTHSQILDGRNIQVGKTTGTKIGTAIDQKLAVFGVTPIVQGASISDPSGGDPVDSQARTAINAIIDRLQAFGIIA